MFQFSFGAVADPHHLDENDRVLPDAKTRYYRNSLKKLSQATTEWANKGVQFVFTLGDLIDGRNFEKDTSNQAYDEVMYVLKKPGCPIFQVVGNHELYNFSHKDLLQMGHYKNSDVQSKNAFFSIALSEDYQLIGINCFDVSVLGYKTSDPRYMRANEVLKEQNPNPDKGLNESLDGLDKRFVDYNGSVGDAQLEWLAEQLELAEKGDKAVIMMGHVPIHPGADSVSGNIVWNYDEVLRVIHQYQCVKLYIAGHVHDPALIYDVMGVCHMTLKGLIETLPHEEGHYTFHVYDDRIEVTEPNTGRLIKIPTV